MAKNSKKNVLQFNEAAKAPKGLKLDLGAGFGKNTPEDFLAVDIVASDNVKQVDLAKSPWPWKSGSVDEARATFMIHYLKPAERIVFFNELGRVLKQGSKAIIHTPHWCSARAYGDPDIQMPPVSEAFYFFLNAEWRAAQNHKIEGFRCDFDILIGYSLHPAVQTRAMEYQQEAMQWYKEAVQEIVVTLTKR